MKSEATYTVQVVKEPGRSVVTVTSNGRPVSVRTVRTVGDCINLGLLLTDPATPFLPVADTERERRLLVEELERVTDQRAAEKHHT